ncbi:MAG TPA: alpha/beta hydrolase [Candidatus Tectomicrobia bacterium]|nr:alpha/beta hydrolase [Candidatus Tectomicrobia bacterium]
MPTAKVNDVRLAYQLQGTGPISVVLVHGSWSSRRNWDLVVPALARQFRVLTYDRRGHSESERPPAQGSVHEDAADLALLLETLRLAPAFVVGNSFGGSIALRLAGQRPDLLRGVLAHEPPLFRLLGGDAHFTPMLAEVDRRVRAVAQRIASGDHEGAARQFAETVALGPGTWAQLPEESRRTMIQNAPTFLDETRDPDALVIDAGELRRFTGPVLLTKGDQSPPTFAPVIARLAAALPQAEVVTLPGAGHVPQLTHPELYVDTIAGFVRRHAAAEPR